jgi:ferredoxin-like protein FixX
MSGFMEMLNQQRWDDHRLYHHNRINQSLHLLSSIMFVVTYVLLFTYPVAGALLGWVVAMITRQIGHFFFEPKGYDEHNQATHQEKEDVKVGYNLNRKVWLLSIWALCPVVLYLQPTTTRRASSSTCRACGSCSVSAPSCFAACVCSSCKTSRRAWSG